MDEGAAGSGSVIFKVLGDGVVLYTSGTLTKGQVAKINVSIAGVKTLTLVANSAVAGNIDYCHADWANAAVYGTPSAPLAPSGLAATAQGSNAIKLSWTNNSSNQTAITVQRSTDGTSFTTITANVAAGATSYTDSGLSASTKYYYRVLATNATGSSPASNIANATTTAVTTTTYVSDLTATSANDGLGHDPEGQEHPWQRDYAGRRDVHQGHRHARRQHDHVQPRRELQDVPVRRRRG